MSKSPAHRLSRYCWLIHGQVQGVGFRPFVYRTANNLGLTGFVRNDQEGVTIEAQGPPDHLDALTDALKNQAPPLAVIESLTADKIEPRSDDCEFQIQSSATGGGAQAAVTVDTAVCDDCLVELLSTGDRRSSYALINCTNCGPRYSIIRRVPYDREQTTMAGFRMCEACALEYADPENRRFHAQPISCPDCGPQLQLVTPQGLELPGDPIAETVKRLMTAQIVAIKGIGGFHLATRATDDAAVARLRMLKHRDAKPFALMCESLDAAGQLVELGPEDARLLLSPARPIVLAARKPSASVSSDVAPGNHRLGVMLPYTPIHYLLFAVGVELGPLVMTSGNISDEPLVIDNEEAVDRLGTLCDFILWHDRPIQRCIDDSVLIGTVKGIPIPIRRSRGFSPQMVSIPIAAPAEAAEGLCVGGELKNTIAVVRGDQVTLSQYLGDLKHPLAFQYFQHAIRDLQSLFNVRPRWIATDQHPLYMSTAHAKALAERWGISLLDIQHHHAHAAAVLAEHNHTGPALAVVCDGVGYGDDGTIWGGELLAVDLLGYQRLARLRPLLLPGGDAAAKDTRRCGLALLEWIAGHQLFEHPAARRLVPKDDERRMLATMIRRRVHCAESSAAGRVFDGVAAILGLSNSNDFEAQAALRLEAAAQEFLTTRQNEGSPEVDSNDRAKYFRIVPDDLSPGISCIDLSLLVRRLIEDFEAGRGVNELAYVFHEQLARAWAVAVVRAVRETGLRCIALSGGVFCNELLTSLLSERLERLGLTVLRHRQVPPNDGGIALGQAAIAAARLSKKMRTASSAAHAWVLVGATKQESGPCV